MKAGEKNYLKESNGTKANCNANVTQVRKSRIYRFNMQSDSGITFDRPLFYCLTIFNRQLTLYSIDLFLWLIKVC